MINLFRTRVLVLARYYPKERLHLKEQIFNLKKDALSDCIETKFSEKYIKDCIVLNLKKSNSELFSIDSIAIKKWWQIWKV